MTTEDTDTEQLQTAPLAADESQRMIRTGSALLLTQMTTWVGTIVGILVIPRFLGPSLLGVFATAIAVQQLVIVGSSLGTTRIITRDVARNPDRSPHIVATAMVLRLSLWAALMLIAIPAVLFFVDDFVTRYVLFAVLIGAGLRLAREAARSGLQGHHTLGRASIFESWWVLLLQGITVAAFLLGGRLVAHATIGVVGSVVSTVLIVTIYWSRFQGTTAVSFRAIRGMAAAGFAFFAIEIARMVFTMADRVTLAVLVGTVNVGIYTFGYRLAAIPIFVPTILRLALFPTLSAAAHRDAAYFRRVLSTGLRLVVGATLPMSVGLAVLAPDLTRLIGGGTKFEDSTQVLLVLCILFPFASVTTVLASAIAALDMQRRWAVITIIAAVVNPMLNVGAIRDHF